MGKLLSGRVKLARSGQIVDAHTEASKNLLICVAQPLEDCTVHVPNTTAPGQLPLVTKACRIKALTPLSATISRALLELPAGRPVTWHPGQYLLLVIQGEEYAYSIANAPRGRHIELHIRHDSGNTNAQKIIEYLAKESVVTVKLPLGERHLQRFNNERPLWLICGSTGFAQAKAIIEDVLEKDPQRPLHLFWGAHDAEGLYLHPLAAEWAAQGKLSYTPVLSHEQREGFAQGLVHEAVLAAPAPAQSPLCLVAGSPEMAWHVFDALVAAGFDPEHIHSDVFDYAPRDN